MTTSSLIRVAQHPVVIGLAIRVLLAWILPAWLDDTDVPYTDIDYHVFSDAAAYVRAGQSPYQRTTYRYTPFLAELLALFPPGNAGRLLFCVADVACGWILWQARQQQRGKTAPSQQQEQSLLSSWLSPETQDAVWWLYNPLAINICTRGSAESLIVLLPVLGTVWCCMQPQRSTWSVLGTGVMHGIAMHCKVYPIIYSLTFATALSHRHGTKSTTMNLPTFVQWIRGFFSTPAPILFGLTALGTAAGLTALAVHRHGPTALYEGVLYHISRVDHRHNYSVHWYGIYLARDEAANNDSSSDVDVLPWMGRLLLVPQAVWLVLTSWKLQDNVPFCLFLQTLVFVAQNKVLTAQYFTWYLCLLPLCSGTLFSSPRLVRAVVGLVASVVLWLLSAYLLEMQGWAVHRVVWIASGIFYAAHIRLASAFLETRQSQRPPLTRGDKKNV